MSAQSHLFSRARSRRLRGFPFDFRGFCLADELNRPGVDRRPSTRLRIRSPKREQPAQVLLWLIRFGVGQTTLPERSLRTPTAREDWKRIERLPEDACLAELDAFAKRCDGSCS